MGKATSSPAGGTNPPGCPPAVPATVAAAVPATVVLILRCPLPAPLMRHLFAIGTAGCLPAAGAANTPANAPVHTTAEQWMAAFAKGAETGADAHPALLAARLSRRELEVVQLIGDGKTTGAIAATLFKSVKTIDTYRSRIRAKLGFEGPTALVQWCWQFVHGGRTCAGFDDRVSASG